MDSVIRKFPIGIQNFESLINDGYVYVDKTALVYRMATTGRYYFLSRPRRFGKSLLLSTIEAYLSGKKELFKGLAIEKLEQKWEEHPILHLDLNTENYKEPDSLRRRLDSTLSYWEQLYGTRAVETSLPLRFEGIVRRACEKTGHRVVILVDEYDKPMLQAIGNETLQAEYRNLLKAFYSVLKSQDRYIKLAFLTGVTKFLSTAQQVIFTTVLSPQLMLPSQAHSAESWAGQMNSEPLRFAQMQTPRQTLKKLVSLAQRASAFAAQSICSLKRPELLLSVK